MDKQYEDIVFPNNLHKKIEIPNLLEFLQQEKEEFEQRLARRIRYSASLKDFELLSVLGSGSFGKVILGKHKKSNGAYAIKLLDKKHVVKGNQIIHTLHEKRILQSLNFPFMVHLECFFQDNSFLYFTMPAIMGGEMFSHIRRCGRFDETLAKFYAAQVLLGLEYLNFMDLIYRDLKPENLLIDSNGYLKISDFGFCKLVKTRTWTLCGTPEYLAPEIILSRGYGKSVDWWSFGVLLYEMCAGYPPFYAKDHLKLYEKIVLGRYKIASHFSSDLVDILAHLLEVDLSKRYGNLKGGIQDVKQHSWFRYAEWTDIVNCRAYAPFVPVLKDDTDMTYFDIVAEEELVIRINKTNLYEKEFAEF